MNAQLGRVSDRPSYSPTAQVLKASGIRTVLDEHLEDWFHFWPPFSQRHILELPQEQTHRVYQSQPSWLDGVIQNQSQTVFVSLETVS